MEIEQYAGTFTPEGEAIIVYTMRNSHGASVSLTNIGAAMLSIEVPDKNGKLADVVLGYEKLLSYMGDGAMMGKTVGRVANRIGNARFTLDGVEYFLPQNVGHDHLHGGPTGFANKLWESRVEVNRVVFSLISPDGDQGYPGEVRVETVYDWDDDNTLEITLLAQTEATTVINLTNHTYFNLAGHDSGSALEQTLRLNSSSYIETGNRHIPTGKLLPVEGTPMDFRATKPLGRDIEADFGALRNGGGYDHCWAVDGWKKGQLTDVGALADPVSGRRMEILSTQPGVQVYTANFMQGGPAGKNGASYLNRHAVAIECQGFPDSPNRPEFPSVRLKSDQIYEQKIVYRFSC